MGKEDLFLIISTWDFGKKANKFAAEVLREGRSPLDAIEKGINVIEEDPEVMSVGYGGLPNEEGYLQLDAAIMSGPLHKAGAVAALEGIVNPISVARKIMEKTKHVLLAGEGALEFALRNGFQKRNLLTDKAKREWLKQKEKEIETHDTIGMILLDSEKNVYAGCSTSGVSRKIPGRVGDSCIIGAGLYVDNEIGGAAATGMGEKIMMFCGSFFIVENMRRGMSPQKACEEVIKRMISKGEKEWVGFIALNKQGEYGAASLGKEFPYAIFSGKEETVKKSKFFKRREND